MDSMRYDPVVVRAVAGVAWAAFLFASWRFVWRPLRSRVTDRQVALYVEEHDPTLRAAVLTGVELGAAPPKPEDARDGAPGSAELTALVIEEANPAV